MPYFVMTKPFWGSRVLPEEHETIEAAVAAIADREQRLQSEHWVIVAATDRAMAEAIAEELR